MLALGVSSYADTRKAKSRGRSGRGEGVNGSTERFPISIAIFALAAFITLVWANSVGGGPIFDDHFLVVGQDCFRSVAGMLDIVALEHCTYRPLRYLSYGIDDLVFGGEFWGFHVGNILRHLLATTLAGLLALELARRAIPDEAPRRAAWFALAVAALWALHPVQTDSVSYVSGRRDILAGLFTMASVWLALVADRRGGLWWVLPLWTTLFAFMSKESAVVIPALFLAWKLREVSVTDWLRSNLGAAISGGLGLLLSFLMVLYRGVFSSHSSRGFEWWGGTIESNFATVAALQVKYVQHVFLSAPLVGDYKPHSIELAGSFADPRAIGGVAVLLALLAMFAWTWRRRPLVSFGISWYLLSLTPVSHIFPHHELYAEHYLYIPLFGAVLALADGARWAMERWAQGPQRVVGTAAAIGLSLTMGAVVFERNRDYADERSFYENVIAHAPENLRAISNLANIYFDAEDWELATHYLVRLSPLWEPGTGDELNHEARLVQAALALEEYDLARETADRLSEHHPDVGLGHRWRAEVALRTNDGATAFDAALDWWDVTHAEQAIPVAVESFHRASLDEPAALRLAAAVRATPDVDPLALQGTAAALGRHGQEAAAFELLQARRDPDSPVLDPMICAIAGRLDSVEAPPYCPRDEPDPPQPQ